MAYIPQHGGSLLPDGSRQMTPASVAILLGSAGEVFRSTLSNIKLAGADADRIGKLASRLSTHAQKSMQSIIQSRRVGEAPPRQSAQSHRRLFGAPSLDHRDLYLPVEVSGPQQGGQPH